MWLGIRDVGSQRWGPSCLHPRRACGSMKIRPGELGLGMVQCVG